MKKYLIIFFLIILGIFFVACQETKKEVTTLPQPEKKTEVVVEKNVEKPAVVEQEPKISEEVKELLSKSKIKVKSIYYKYRGPETGTNFHEFYIKNDKIKYRPWREIKALDKPDSFDVIFFDKKAWTAISYCEAAYCATIGKKADLNYNNAYIQTIFDWLEGLTKASKVGEEVIDDRSTWKIETNQGILWIDTFYGIPLKVESKGQVYRFEQISVNSVQDSDVIPSS